MEAEDFASAAMMRLVAAGLTRQGIAPPRPPAGARVPRDMKRRLLEGVMAAHGPLAVLRIADAVPHLPPDPVVQALTRARDPADLLARWSRLERFSHGRHRVTWDLQGDRITLHHLARSGPPPTVAETLLVLAVLAMLVEGVGGAVEMCRADGRVLRAGGIWHGIDPAPLGPVTLRAPRAMARPMAMPPGPGDDLPTLIRRQIAADPLRRWRLPALSSELGLPPRTLQRRLSTDGASLTALVARARLEVAAALLCQPKGPTLAETAFRSGYADQPHFARAFHRAVGTTPAAYRAAFGG